MARIFGWAGDNGACGYYRMRLPLDTLARSSGHTTGCATQMPQEDFDTADVIIGQRVCATSSTETWQYLAKHGRARLVYEVDDDLFTVDPSSVKAYDSFSRPEIRANIAANASVADVVTVSTEPLAEVMRQHNPNVVVAPNRIPRWLLDHQRPQRDRVTLGWGGSATHAMDFAEIGPQLVRFLKRNPHVDYHAMGAGYDYLNQIPTEQLLTTRWIPSVPDYLRAVDFDVALAPLRPHVFNRSKSSIKALEAAALGIPAVASEVGPYATAVQHGETGLLVRRDHEWGQHLRTLSDDPGLRRKLGENAKEWARAQTIEANLDPWLTAWGLA